MRHPRPFLWMPQNLIENVDEAHFIIVMHGQNSFGARSKTGSEIAPCSGAPLVEQENCDANSVFVSIEENTNFDDRVAFFSPVSFAEWQRAAADPTKIHLRATDSVAIGANIANDLSDVEQLTAKSTGAGTGNIRANIAVHASDICMEPIGGATFDPLIHCFSPALIGGALVDSVAVPGEKYSVGGRGISCFEEANPNVEYLVGMQNGIADCVPEVFQSCPRGSYVQGINADFVVQCTRPPEDPCPAMQQTTICGDTGTLPPTDSSQVGLLYSGQCEMITEYDANYFRTTFASMTFAQMQAHIDTLNAEPRTIVDCGASADTALVRDNYMCTDGDWSYLSSHEKTSFYRDFLDASYPAPTRGPHSYWDAEVGGGPDPLNSNHDHDCWCREDYRVLERSYCPDGTTGTVLEVRKRLCPATTYSWGVIYRDYETNCTCVPAEDEPESQTCNSYLDELNDDAIGTASGLTGSVIKYYDTECVDGSPVRTLTSIDTSDCACSVQPDVDTPQSCPEGLTNSWTLPGVGSLTGVETYTRQSWICPATTTTGGLPSPGYLGDPVELGSPPACECASFTDIEAAACPPGQGGQEFYEKEWDCTLNGGMGGFEPQEDWTYLEGQSTCNTCVWAQPPGAGDVGEFPIGNEVSRACSCGVGPSVCYSATGAGYEYWSGCLCEVSP